MYALEGGITGKDTFEPTYIEHFTKGDGEILRHVSLGGFSVCLGGGATCRVGRARVVYLSLALPPPFSVSRLCTEEEAFCSEGGGLPQPREVLLPLGSFLRF